MILAGDIGGTHTRLALFEKRQIVAEKKFDSKKYQGLQEIIEEFLRETKGKVERACFGVAGPVRNGACKATNLPWIIDSHELSRTLSIPFVRLLNDLEANAYGIRMLKKDELLLLHQGQPNQQGNQALISAGTGLGEAGLYWDGIEHRPFACEGGHTDFAPRDEMECELLIFLKNKFGHVSYERVVSGPGLLLLYQFLIETKREKPAPEVQQAMERTDPAIVVSEWGRMHRDPACSGALDWFISLYGAEAGNLALKFLSLGGLYIGGGIAPILKERIQSGPFLNALFSKGRFQGLLESMSVWMILNNDAALLGAAYFGERLK